MVTTYMSPDHACASRLRGAYDIAPLTPESVQLRLPEEAVEAIDRAIEEGEALVKPSRHAWLFEANAEKLQREGIAVRL